MPIDPRRQSGGSADVRAAQRVGDLERRISQLEQGTKGAIVNSGIATQTASYTLTATSTLVPGLTLTFNTAAASNAIVTFTAYTSTTVRNTGTQSNTATFFLHLNGVDQPKPATISTGVSDPPTIRIDVNLMAVQVWKVALPVGTNTLLVKGGGLATVSAGSLSYLQTRV